MEVIAGSSSGRTAGSGPVNLGSSPSPATKTDIPVTRMPKKGPKVSAKCSIFLKTLVLYP